MTMIERNARNRAVKDVRRRNLEKTTNMSKRAFVVKKLLKVGLDAATLRIKTVSDVVRGLTSCVC